MIGAPGFWNRRGPLSTLLLPASAITAAITANRVARPGWPAPVPVICVGNATVGGTGKTPVAMDIAARLAGRGMHPHFLTRGHGRRGAAHMRVDPTRHSAAEAGDEPLLMAAAAPTWVGTDRAATARAAVAAGADVLIMDDGLQNPTLEKTLSFMVIDGAACFGNGRLLPAGPLREPVVACAARVQAAILIGTDTGNAASVLPSTLPILRATTRPGPEIEALRGQRILAFAGIGRPEKFFRMLEQAGMDVVARHSFHDHHVFTTAELRRLNATAATVSVCTMKDYVRIPPDARAAFTPIGMWLDWQDGDALDTLLGRAVA